LVILRQSRQRDSATERKISDAALLVHAASTGSPAVALPRDLLRRQG
jgi:hypothetical protein